MAGLFCLMDCRDEEAPKTKSRSDDRQVESSDQELIRNAFKGDKNAFKDIVRKYEHQVAATVIGMLGYSQEAEDIGQETFIRLYQSLDRFRGESSLGTYLTRIAINLSVNELRRRKRLRRYFSSSLGERMEQIPDTKSSNKNRDIREIVRRSIQKLEPKFRSVIVLRLMNGYSTQETAEILRVPVGTVLSRLARAQMKLKDILTPLIGGRYENKGDEKEE